MSASPMQSQQQGQIQAATATASLPTQANPAATQCRGYILAHQHPSFASPTPADPAAASETSLPASASGTAAADPYSIIPCPFPACAPAQLSPSCAARSPSGESSSPAPKPVGETENIFQKKLKGGCAKARWCERHWCGGCKRVNGLGKQTGEGLSHGVIDAEQREGGDEYGHVRVETPMPGTPAVKGGEDGMPLASEQDEPKEGKEGMELDGKTADLTLDCQVHMRGETQSSEPAHEIRL